MSNTLYRKYRPKKFSEIIGQQHIVRTLSNAVKHNRIGQAYLLTGPRGTGKTTLARVFAKAVNCTKRDKAEPCQKCEVCKNISEGKSLDIIEIDAASNTGVDNIRELRETVQLPPTQAGYKVYIIDEVHMLSSGAFNALLKTLEEPPAHVIFILATTEIHKVPETILSRCQRFDFSRLTLEQITEKLSDIAKKEGVEIEKDALEMIAISAEGGMRDAESLLAQIITLEDKNITSKEVEEILGSARRESVAKMAALMLGGKTHEALDLVNVISKEGIDFEVFHKSLLNYLRQLMIISVSEELTSLFRLEIAKDQLENMKKESENYSTGEILNTIEILIEAQQNIRSSFIPSLPLEIAIVKSAGERQDLNARKDSEPGNIVKSNPQLATGNSDNKYTKERLVKKDDDGEKKNDLQVSDDKSQTNKISVEIIKDNWQKIVAATRPHNHSLMAFLSNCEPLKTENGLIIIATRYNLYKDKLNDKNNRKIIEEVMAKIIGAPVSVKFITEEEAGIKITLQPTTNNSPKPDKENMSLLDDAMKIMGGKIVEE